MLDHVKQHKTGGVDLKKVFSGLEIPIKGLSAKKTLLNKHNSR